MLEVGTKAPDFELPDQNGNVHKLSEMDYLVFVSAQGVEAFSRNDTKQLPKQVKIACIGEVTAEQAKKTFGRVDLVAKVNDVAGLVEIISKDYKF